LSSTFEAIGNKIGKYVKTSEETLKGRYTSYARICIKMDVSGALPEAIILEFRDEEWIQSIDYVQILFRCRRCHEHGHLLTECPLSKNQEPKNTKQYQDEDDFLRSNHKGRGNKRQGKPPTGSNLEARNKKKGRGNHNQGEEEEKKRTKARETSKHETHETTKNFYTKGDPRSQDDTTARVVVKAR
jgi:hypothetical protein